MKKLTIHTVIVPLYLISGTVWAQDQKEEGRWIHRATVPTARPGEVRPHSWIREMASPDATAHSGRTPGGFHPVDILTAYEISSNGGAGATVAVVDAYDAPNAQADLNTFSAQFGLPAANFVKVNQFGQTVPFPRKISGWEVETSLDIQWVHAIAPYAKIVLVEANSSNTSDLLAAVNYAKSVASVVSMSWGGNESRSQVFFDSTFVQRGVTFLASSGDVTGIVSWPASSPNVLGVGGTQLAVNSTGGLAQPVVETAWNGSGGGCSAVEAAIAAQRSFVPSSCPRRGSPDVSISGGDASAVSVYVSSQGGWFEVYGTSLSVQLFAGLIANANAVRGANTLHSTLADLYSDAANPALYSNNFRDIATYLSTERSGKFAVTPGWDEVTGLGSPLMFSLGSYLNSINQ